MPDRLRGYVPPAIVCAIDSLCEVKQDSGRNEWPLGLITKVHSSKDGYVRHVHLKLQPNGSSKSKIIHRSIHDLVLIIPSPELETPQLK